MEYFEWVHESEVCPRYWTNNYHAFCYAEHLEEWLRVGYSLEQMHFVKSEELKDMATREAVVAAAARFDGSNLEPESQPESELNLPF